jgi:hypothetical protein
MRKLRIIKFMVYAAQFGAGALICFFLPIPLQFFVGWLFKSITDWGWKVLSEDSTRTERPDWQTEMEKFTKSELKSIREKEVSNG